MTDQEIIYKAIRDVVNTDKPSEFAAHNSTLYNIAKYVCEEVREELKSLPSEQLSKEDLEEAVQEHVKKLYGENWMDFVYTQEAAFRAELSFKSGANWQKEQLINKACEWLQHNAEKYDASYGFPDCLLLKDFKKAMEE